MAHTQDEGFHEIQLNGKQLVFLFMAATVVSVVIFLCGVLVGRGVRAERGTVAENTAINSAAETTPPQQASAPPPAPAPAGSDPTKAAPPAPVDDLSYFARLEKDKAPPEQLKPASPKNEPRAAAAAPPPAPAPAPAAVEAKAAPAPAPPPPAPPAAKPTKEAKEPARAAAVAAAATTSEPSGAGYAVQIAALNVRDEAEAIAKRLSSKGYAAYVMSPATGSPVIYRVRIGKFPSRREAESVAAKLKKEEQLNPWVTR